MPKPISLSGFSLADLRAPGGVERLLDAHRAVFGDAVMEDDNDGGSSGGQGSGDGDQGQQQGDKGDKGGDAKVTFTPEQQAHIEQLVKDRLERDRRARAPKDKGGDGQKSEIDRLAAEVDQVKQENATLKSDLAKKDRDALAQKVADAKGVPSRYITGDDEKAMNASADQFLEDLKDLGVRRAPGVVPTAGTGNQSKSVSSMEAGRERALAQLEKNK